MEKNIALMIYSLGIHHVHDVINGFPRLFLDMNSERIFTSSVSDKFHNFRFFVHRRLNFLS